MALPPAFRSDVCWVLSDLHLNEHRPDDFHHLVTILERATRDGVPVICGGDLFDLFLGWPGCLTSQQKSLFEILSRLKSRGLRFYWIEGNRDYRPSIWQEVCAEIDRLLVWDLGDQRYVMVHGDLLNVKDWKHLLWTGLTKNPFTLFMPRLLPHRLTKATADYLYHRLHPYGMRRQVNFPFKAVISRLKKLQQKSGADVILLGHYHRFLRFQIDNPDRDPLQGWVVPSWDDNPVYLEFRAHHAVVACMPDGRPLDLEAVCLTP